MNHREARHTPDGEQLNVWRDYIESAEMLRSRIDRRLAEESHLSLCDYRVLLALHEAETRVLRPSELADVIEWERSRLSHHLGRMEARGLVLRERCAEGSRGVNVSITAKGLDTLRSASAHHLRAVKELFIDALSPADAQRAGEVAVALRVHLGSAPAEM